MAWRQKPSKLTNVYVKRPDVASSIYATPRCGLSGGNNNEFNPIADVRLDTQRSIDRIERLATSFLLRHPTRAEPQMSRYNTMCSYTLSSKQHQILSHSRTLTAGIRRIPIFDVDRMEHEYAPKMCSACREISSSHMNIASTWSLSHAYEVDDSLSQP